MDYEVIQQAYADNNGDNLETNDDGSIRNGDDSESSDNSDMKGMMLC